MTIQPIQRIRRTLAALASVGLLAAPTTHAFAGSEPVSVERIDIRGSGSVREVVVHTSKAPTFSVFRLTEPFRILLDVNNAKMAESQDLRKVNDGLIRYISTNKFSDEASSILRVEVALDEKVPYAARAEGNSVILTIGSERPLPKKVTGGHDAAAGRVRLGAFKRKVRSKDTLLYASMGDGAVSRDEVKVEALAEPPRLVIDVPGATVEPKWQRVRLNRHGVRNARVADKNGSVRVVLDLTRGAKAPKIDVRVTKRRLVVAMKADRSAAGEAAAAGVNASPAAVKTAAAEPSPTALPIAETARAAANTPVASIATADRVATAAAPAPSAPAAEPSAPARTAVIQDVRFEPKDGFVRLTLHLAQDAGRVHADREQGNSAVLRLMGAQLPEALERTLDVTEVAPGVVDSISTYNEAGTATVLANIRPGTEHRHWRKGNKLMWDFRNRGVPAAQRLTYDERSTTGYQSAATAARTISQAAPSQRQARYTGRRISLDLKGADIQNVLRLLADVSKLNIVAAEDVRGKITIKLRNVPWDQALDIILRSKQLDKVRNGNIIRVAPISVLQDEEKLRVERAKSRVQLEPLSVRLIPVSYAVANDVAPQVQALLSERGKVNIDKRTNVLVVEDIREVLVKVERLVRTLDTQTPQVLIEARIVEARSNFSRELGIQWGGQVIASQATGNSTGLSFPNLVRVAGGADDPNTPGNAGVLTTPNYAVNLPATVGSGTGGALGFTLGSIGGSALVNIRLSAAEAEGKVKIISAPKVVTLDNAKARIVSGEQIPITVITANGPTTRFIAANLELNVVPHVTQDGSILMAIEAKKNELSDRVDNLGVPGIITKEANTAMIVRDGDTAVLGGIYRRTATENENYIPWLGRIPVLGWLFKSSQRSDTRDELLIFISPRIVNRSAALVNTN